MTPARRPATDPAFDRIPRRRGDGPAVEPDPASQTDQEGKRALFSGVSQPPVIGAVAVTCSRCGRRSVVSWWRLVRLSLPGVHLPVLEDRRPAWKAWVTCPACRTRSWVAVGVRL